MNFHWERKETQTFLGALRFVVESDKIYAINELPVERYLESVISSEMSATSSLELLKAHAVISRSWLLAQMQKRREVAESGNNFFSFTKKEDTLIRWYDREDHTLFDVCADDHCQRYQGITKETSPHVAEAIRLTRGQVLLDGGEICEKMLLFLILPMRMRQRSGSVSIRLLSAIRRIRKSSRRY